MSSDSSDPESGCDSDGKVPCTYGDECYRDSEEHLQKFTHPKDKKKKKSKKKKKKTKSKKTKKPKSKKSKKSKKRKPDSDSESTTDVEDDEDEGEWGSQSSDLPPCKYGAKCFRQNLLHFAEFAHPSKSSKKRKKASGKVSESDSSEDDDEEDGKKLKRSYSSLSTKEIKKLLKGALQLQHKVKVQAKKLKAAKKKLEGEDNLLPGEAEAMKKNKYTVFELKLSRQSEFGNVAEFHYRYAESQFLRLSQAAVHCVKVEYVVNPPLVKKFEAKRKQLEKQGIPSHHVLGFHGTPDANIDKICKSNLRMPAKSYMGSYGAGIYFSEYSGTSMAYGGGTPTKGRARILLFKVLVGKQYQCLSSCPGIALKKGYTSHLSPCGSELVIFDTHQVLPCYIVTYAAGAAQVDNKNAHHKKAKATTAIKKKSTK